MRSPKVRDKPSATAEYKQNVIADEKARWPPWEKSDRKSALEEDISIHIFSTSATMVGICLTVIGLFRVILQLKSVGTLADDFLSIDAMLFLVACSLAYCSLRTRNTRRRRKTERIADLLFLLALSVMTAICALITYAVV